MPAAVVIGGLVAVGVAEAIGVAAITSIIGAGAISSVAATAVGAGIISGGLTAIQGGSASDALKSAVMTGATSFIGGSIGQALSSGSSGVSNITDAEFIAADAAQLAQQGLGAEQIAQNLTSYGVNESMASQIAMDAFAGMNPADIATGYATANLFNATAGMSIIKPDGNKFVIPNDWKPVSTGQGWVDSNGYIFDANGTMVDFAQYPQGDWLQVDANGVATINGPTNLFRDVPRIDITTPTLPTAGISTGAESVSMIRGNEVLWNGSYDAGSGQYFDTYGNPINSPFNADAGMQVVSNSTGQVLQSDALLARDAMIPVQDASGATGYFDPATGRVYDANMQLQPSAEVAQAGPGTQVASSQPFRVEVSGAAGTVEAPSYVTGPLSEGTKLATNAEIDAGLAKYNTASNAWEVTATPAPLSPIVPVDIPASVAIPEVVVTAPSIIPSLPAAETVGAGVGGAVNTAYSPLTVSGPITPADAAVGAVSAPPVTPTTTLPEVVVTAPSTSTGQTVGQTVGAVAPVVTTPTAVAPSTTTNVVKPGPAPGINDTGSPAVTTTTNPDGTSTTKYADGTTQTTSTDYSKIGAAIGAAAVTPGPVMPTIPTVTAAPYTFGTAQPLVNPGVNPGYLMGGIVRPQTVGATPTQTQYYWGGRPLITDINQLGTYNTAIPTTQPYGAAYAAGTGTNQLNLQDTINAVLGRGQALSGLPTATTPVAPTL